MIQTNLWRLTVLALWAGSALSVAHAGPEATGAAHQLIAGDRIVLGVVEEVRSDQARVGTGEVQPRFIPINVRKEKGLPDLKKGDLVEMTLNDQNLLVDVHMPGESNHHRIVTGQLAGPLETGHDKAVIRTTDGKEASHMVRPVAQSKVASIPVGADVIFLIDELDKIVDVTFGSKEAVQRATDLSQKMSPPKGNLSQIVGVISTALKNNTIVIRTENGKEHSYEVRPLIQPRLGTLVKGDAATLLVDEENKVTDVAFVPNRPQ